jgi:hypothetical protein
MEPRRPFMYPDGVYKDVIRRRAQVAKWPRLVLCVWPSSPNKVCMAAEQENMAVLQVVYPVSYVGQDYDLIIRFQVHERSNS